MEEDIFAEEERITNKSNKRGRSSIAKSPAVVLAKKSKQKSKLADTNIAEQMEKLKKEIELMKEQLSKKDKQLEQANRGKNVIKFPSEATAYSPAVQRIFAGEGVIQNRVNQVSVNNTPIPGGFSRETPVNTMINKNDGGSKVDNLDNDIAEKFQCCLNKFLNEIRLGTSAEQTKTKDVRRHLDFSQDRNNSTRDRPKLSDDEIRQRARDRIIEAERYKAALEPPKGNPIPQCTNNDDNFVHVVCHVEDSVIERVEDKKIVDFDKLLPQLNSRN